MIAMAGAAIIIAMFFYVLSQNIRTPLFIILHKGIASLFFLLAVTCFVIGLQGCSPPHIIDLHARPKADSTVLEGSRAVMPVPATQTVAPMIAAPPPKAFARPRPIRRGCTPTQNDVDLLNRWKQTPGYEYLTGNLICEWRLYNVYHPIDPAIFFAQIGYDSPAVMCHYSLVYPSFANQGENGVTWPGIGVDIKGEKFFAPFTRVADGNLEVELDVPCYQNMFIRFPPVRAVQTTTQVTVPFQQP